VTCGALNTFNNTYLNDCWEYNVQTNSWTAKSDFPGTPRVWPVSFVVDGLAYVGTGLDALDSLRKDFYSYNNATDTWTPISDFPYARVGATAFTLSNTGFVGFGDDDSIKCFDLWYYDKATDNWIAAATFPGMGRDQAYGFVINNKFYLAGGLNNHYSYMNDLWEYSPDTTLGIQSAIRANQVSLMIKGDEIKLLGSNISFPAHMKIFNRNGKIIYESILHSNDEVISDAIFRELYLIYFITDNNGWIYSDKVKIVN
jgi:N-acetylneuraminic acid mutarotase